MVLQRRLDYGFSGYQVPVVPRASRSVRGKVPIRKARQANPIHAFEILASVAGELLQETEISAPNTACGDDQNNNINWEREDKLKSLKTEPPEQETFENSFAYVPGLQEHHQIYEVNQSASGSCFCTVAGDFPRSGEFCRGNAISAVETKPEAELSVNRSRQSEKICFSTRWPFANSRNASRGPSRKIGGDSPQSGEFFRGQVDSVIERKSVAKSSIAQSITSGTLPVKGCLDTQELHRKRPALVGPESNLTASLFRDHKTCRPLSKFRANIEVDSKDDGGTFVRCSQPHTMVTAYRPLPNAVDRMIRNLSASGHWRAAPKMKDWKRKPVYCNGRTCYNQQISRRISPFKRRKLFNHIPLSTSAGEFHYKGIFNSPYKSSNGDSCCAVKGGLSSVAGQQLPPKTRSRDCNVKLSIKSLKVPELLIEIPTTATIGSLKRTVVEAVTSILGDGLRVGVLLQGKTVRDDSKTLLQSGISHDDKHHGLGFMLEPHTKITPPPHSEDSLLLSGGTCKGLTGHAVSLPVQRAPSDVTLLPQVMNSGCSVDIKVNAVRSLEDILINNTMPDSKPLVAVPAVSMEALAVVPFHQKPSSHEFVQRRTRRPFSVPEVEALVEAVEKLGTGRWRDIKYCAFDNTKHRTYVDLKDKWKTLVHTARISPQQRRGEPVPQQLLDRVLAAHTFWSQQQAKQLFKLV